MIPTAVALAGACGALARYIVDAGVRTRFAHPSPWGTFVVNVSGSFAAGLVAGLLLYRGLDDAVATVAGVGFVGAYTTFSTFAFEVVEEADQRGSRAALSYALGSIVVGLGAATLGLAISEAV